MESTNQNRTGFLKYSDMSIRKLKKLFLTEAKRTPNGELVMFLSKLLRSKYKQKTNLLPDDVNHQSEFNKDFWKHCEQKPYKEEKRIPVILISKKNAKEKTFQKTFKLHLGCLFYNFWKMLWIWIHQPIKRSHANFHRLCLMLCAPQDW